VVGPELKGQIYGRDSDTWRIERAGQGDRVVEDGVAPRFVGSCGCGAEPQTPHRARGVVAGMFIWRCQVHWWLAFRLGRDNILRLCLVQVQLVVGVGLPAKHVVK
jgi:hypothetical protein